MAEVDLEQLKSIARFEDNPDRKSYMVNVGWACGDVKLHGGTAMKLYVDGLIERVSESSRANGYRLSQKARALIDDRPIPKLEPNGEPVKITPGIFDDIIGHDEVKELLVACLTAPKPVHVLLTGPPALAKSLFLWDIERVGGDKVVWLVGSAISKAGLWDMIADRRPEILLVDELDKVNAADTAALLSIMEGGRMVRAKKGRELDTRIEARVVAATNVESKLSPELRSRFAIRRLNAYDQVDFRQVVMGVMVRHEGISPDIASEIADLIDGRTQDVRDAVRVARLTPRLGPKKAVSLLLPRG